MNLAGEAISLPRWNQPTPARSCDRLLFLPLQAQLIEVQVFDINQANPGGLKYIRIV